MELRHLRYFVAVAQELHFGRAAVRLNISQPPLTQQIHNLEEELGVILFDRSNRKVSLTTEGEIFLKRAESILHQVEKATTEVRKSALGEMDTLVIGYMGSTILREIIANVRRFREDYPMVKLDFVIMRSDEQYEALLDGKIDAGFVDLSVQPMSDRFASHHVEFDLVVHEKLCVAMQPNHPLSARESIDIADLKNENFVTLQRHLFPSNYDKVVSQCEQAGFSPNIVAMSEQTDVLLAYVATGVGIALVPSCTQNSWANEVAFVPLSQTAYVDVHLISSADNQSKSLQALRRYFS
ncbi:LysR substrate-binding domain-containing protein [Pseudoteredinibacter isoporae]|uniref:DNA-binding transcriptional LysR family regulator n=1 Tax=Pseudoteredinibacter isoporae TaxID=570281 RepID=A0A7X0JV27_9GAMM|nr:LysR substrate-binding domain-containing protein [Pseudoteredinibacter isoporae]MBB6522263.1 DNA-binding transcriptional LysR family regulator [Pseudoteredinibacter isoporae]NHO87796.1 LysR family transcriptional regulator [Pseudoteredinibacter isoporae]NIB23873.1 LysR family transcriptional regulator [Pseudoteredinibacter isoporae]